MKTLATGFATTLNRRSADGVEFVEGIAVPYNSWSQPIFRYFKERFLPGCFTDWISQKREILALCNHENSQILGRSSEQTLTLRDSGEGLFASVRLANTTYARDLLLNIEARNIKGMSFYFDSIDETWAKEDGLSTRTISKSKLYEVSFVTNPAYTDTTANARSMLDKVKEIEMEYHKRANPLPERRLKRASQLLKLLG